MSTGKRLIYILWPSFIVAGIAEAVFFTLFDPTDLRFFDREMALSRTAAYSIGFFLFWLFAAGSSALTCFFQRSSAELNRSRRQRFDPPQTPGRERAVH
jgi:hypothetical protein